MLHTQKLAAIILAAGKGTRMNTTKPKVLCPLAGRPIIHHVMDALKLTAKQIVIVGYGADEVEKEVEKISKNADCVLQTKQLGTGHAALCAKEKLATFAGDAVVVCGDVPLITTELIEALAVAHAAAGNTITVLTTRLENPTGLGRILRNEQGEFVAIVEEKDAAPQQRTITEVNSGIYLVNTAKMFHFLEKTPPSLATGEIYLTTIISLMRNAGEKIGTYESDLGLALLGVNTPEQLMQMEALLKQAMQYPEASTKAS